MVKITGLLFLFVSCCMCGLSKSRNLKKRVELLGELKCMILYLAGEIRCMHETLPEAFQRISGRLKTPYRELLRKIAEEMEREGKKTIVEIFDREVSELKNFPFDKEDLELIKNLGKQLGYLDIQMQLKNLELCEGLVEVSMKKASAEYLQKAKMYRYMGVLAGLFLVIILV